MSILICELTGVRGRRMSVYDNKCVIVTNVSLGSVLTGNALDGEKTIFYADVVGIQFKESGLTIGYLQLETPSIQMNNQSSNMFSENTFTYEESNVPSRLVKMVRDYIVDRVESYKYGIPAQSKSLYELVCSNEKTDCFYVNQKIIEQVKIEMQDEERRREQEKVRTKREEQQRMAETLQRALQENKNAGKIDVFLSQAALCKRVVEVQELWKNAKMERNDATDLITKKISEAAQIERLYGGGMDGVQRLVENIKKLTV